MCRWLPGEQLRQCLYSRPGHLVPCIVVLGREGRGGRGRRRRGGVTFSAHEGIT